MDEERSDGQPFPWFAEAVSRRAVFGLFGFVALTAACDSTPSASSSSSSVGAAGPTTASTTTASATTSPTTALSSTGASATASTSTITTITTTTPPTEPTVASTQPSPPTTPVTSGTIAGTEASVVPGINHNITSDILKADAEVYGRSWTAAWKFDDGSASGTMKADVVVDVTGRTVTARGTVSGPLLSAPIPPIETDVSIDSYVYDDNGNFEIHYPTAVGMTTLRSDGGFGKFRLHIDVANRDDAVAFDAAGVANRPSLIPITFSITAADGTKRAGTIQAHPG